MSKKSTKTITDSKKIEEALTRGVAEVLPSKDVLKEVMMEGKRLRLYQGFDPTGKDLHIGSMVGLMKLKHFQDLGHEVIFLIGDGTGQAGDPSGKNKARKKYFERKELRENAKNYVLQAGKVVRFEGENAAKILFNGDWLEDLNLPKILEIAGNFTLQQLSERSMFQDRMAKGEPVNLREFLYPLLQGYDSVAMEVDLEIGGTDQKFNMLAGRTLVKKYLDKEKHVITTPLLTDSAGKKIGKSEGNVIAITDKPNKLFGEVMGLSDDVIIPAFEYLTDISMDKVQEYEKDIKSGANPKEAKEDLAYEIVKLLNTEKDAQEASKNFEKVFKEGEEPEDIEMVKVKSGNPLYDVLKSADLVSSKTKFRRLVDNKAIREINGDFVVDDHNFNVEENISLRVGKKRFIKIIVE